MEHSAHVSHSPAATTYNINFQVASPTAGVPSQLSFVVTEQKVGDPIETFELSHDRLMHLIIVDETLSYFAHVHPVLQSGAFHVSHVFPSPGQYKLWADVKPAGSAPVLAAFRLDVASGSTTSDSGEESGLAGHQVTLTPMDAPLHQAIELTFEIADPEGRPVTDLEPLMAAGGHCVIISSDLRDFLHVHPVEEVDATWRGGPQVKFITSFDRPGRFKAWGQFQRLGELITAAFNLNVREGSHS
jgi:P-type Cu+ transporter